MGLEPMKIDIFEDNLTKEDLTHITPRTGVRGVMKHGDTYVLVYNRAWNLYTLPGGGVNKGETLEDALRREVLEETGFTIKNIRKTLHLTEHFYDSIWEHHFFYCESDGQAGAPALTKEEQLAGLETVFMSLSDAMETFLSHESNQQHADNIYQREFLGFIHSVTA